MFLISVGSDLETLISVVCLLIKDVGRWAHMLMPESRVRVTCTQQALADYPESFFRPLKRCRIATFVKVHAPHKPLWCAKT